MCVCGHIYCITLITISVNTGDKQGANWYQRHQIIAKKARVYFGAGDKVATVVFCDITC